MRSPFAILLLVAGCVSLVAPARSQSLADVARKEKARRAENTKAGKSSQVVVVDETALRNAEASTFSAVEVTGAPERAETSETAPSQVGHPAPFNPNRNQIPVSPKTPRSTTSASASSRVKGPAATELGRGWSTNHDNNTGLRPAPPGTQPIHPTMPGMPGHFVGLDRNGIPIR